MDLLRTLPVGGVSLNNAPKKNIMAVALEDVPKEAKLLYISISYGKK